ncbi:MAG: beta-galactosidase [Victivallales bacterium]|nr:beta-galactosidase [Victivallales bacterium]
MRQFYVLLLVALSFMGAVSSQIPLEESFWEGHTTIADGVLTVVDDSATAGIYAITRDFIPLPEGDFQFGAWCGTENVTTDSKVYLRLFDAQGNQVGHFGTAGANDVDSKDHFVLLERVVTAAERPAAAVQAKLLLQAATGPAEATGTAAFRNVFLSQIGPPPALEGTVDWSDVTYFKTRSIDLQGVRKHGPFAWSEQFTGVAPTLELSWAVPKYPAALSFLSSQQLHQPVYVEAWNDRDQRYDWMMQVLPEFNGTVTTLDLKAAPQTRKLLLHFPQPLRMNAARFCIRKAVEENWTARWIWFTAERVDHVNCWLRKEFELSEAPVEAWLQSCADDNGEIFINGKSVGYAGNWKNPPVREVSKYFRVGRNVISAEVKQNRYAAGLLAELDCRFADGTETKICSDASWQCSREEPSDDAWKASGFSGEGWQDAQELFRPPQGDWGAIPYTMKANRIPIELAVTRPQELPPSRPGSRPRVVTNNPLVEKLVCGYSYEWKFDLHCETPLAGFRPVELVLSKGGVEFRRISLGALEDGATEAHLKCGWQPGEYLYPGTYHLALAVPGCEVFADGALFERDIEVVNDHQPAPVASQVAPGAFGQPTLFVDGEPTMPFLSILYPGEVNYPEARQSGKAGLKLIHVYGRLLNAPDGNYDFSFVDNVIYTALRGNPDAHLFLRITLRDSVNPEFYWEHPDELVMLDDGTRMRHPSLASKVWRAEVKKMFTALIQHIQEGPYADRVVGFLPSDGEEGQWMHYWGGDDPAKDGTLTDYSPAMLNYFREWLARKYGTDEALQAAWGQPDVTLATAQIPSRAARAGDAEEGVFRKLPRDRAVIDYAEALSDVVDEDIQECCRVVKEASGGKLLTGILYGHIMDLGGTFMGEQVGYLKLRKVIECPDLDFIAGPISYWSQFRDMGGPGAFDYPTPATLRLHNKLWINEVDLRTHLLDSNDHVSDVTTAYKTEQAIGREFALSLCSNAGLWLCNLAGGQRSWFDDTETASTMTTLQQTFANRAPQQDLRSVAEVAVVFCDRSLTYLRPLATSAPRTQDGIMETLMVWQRLALRRLGAPFDAYLADDFLNPDLPHYKFYIFMDTFFLTDEERAAIQARLAEDDATALWFYAPGVIDGKGLDSAKIAELTGISVTLDFTTRETAGMVDAEAGKPLNLPQQYSFLPAATPQVDDEIAVLAYKTDGTTPAVVRKGKSYFSAYAGLTPEFLRKIAREAGVFIYSEDDDAIYANASYLAVHTSKRPGPRTIHLPAGVQAVLLWPLSLHIDGKSLEVLQFDSDEPHTRIYKLSK